jgi:hypothetical protein
MGKYRKFLNLALDGVEWPASHIPAVLPLGNMPLCPMDRKVGRPQDWSGQCRREKFLPLRFSLLACFIAAIQVLYKLIIQTGKFL